MLDATANGQVLNGSTVIKVYCLLSLESDACIFDKADFHSHTFALSPFVRTSHKAPASCKGIAGKCCSQQQTDIFGDQQVDSSHGERQSMNRGGAEREGDTELETGSRLRAISPEPDAGLELTDREIVTWLKSDA